MTQTSPPSDLKVPRSVAIIMDGNGRWARSRGLERTKGHERAVTAVRETVEECRRLGVEALTMYAFSEENWRRPAHEIGILMRMLERFLQEERPGLVKNQVRLLHAGRRERLPARVLHELDETRRATAACRGMQLVLALSYGGRAEIVDAVRQIASDVRAGKVRPDELNEETIRRHLYLPQIPDPDLLIRTAGEMRISNFLLWQISYAEIHVTDVCWPDFRKHHLWQAFEAFGRRVRRFGSVVT